MLLQFISNALAKALIVSDTNPLPAQQVTSVVFVPGSLVADVNPLPVVQTSP